VVTRELDRRQHVGLTLRQVADRADVDVSIMNHGERLPLHDRLEGLTAGPHGYTHRPPRVQPLLTGRLYCRLMTRFDTAARRLLALLITIAATGPATPAGAGAQVPDLGGGDGPVVAAHAGAHAHAP